MLITTRQRRQNLDSSLPIIYIEGIPVEEVDSHKVLGITIDNNLRWNVHINNLYKMLSKKVYQLCRMKHFLNLHARKLFLHGHILSSISYASTLYDTASANSLKPLLSVYKRAIKSVLLKPSRLNKNDYYSLEVLPLKEMLAVNKGILMQKIVQRLLTPTLTTKFYFNARDSSKLQIPIPRIDMFKSSLCYSGSVLWNQLPSELRSLQSPLSFKKNLISHYKTIPDN